VKQEHNKAMKYKHMADHPIYKNLFAVEIDVPDELGQVISSIKGDGPVILVTCEHGVYTHRYTKRNTVTMKSRGIAARTAHLTRPKKT
jgi:hypothetical protein